VGLTRGGLARLPREILRWCRERSGLLTSNFAESGGFIKSDPMLPRPDLQLHFVVGLVDDHARKRHFCTGYSLHTCVLWPKSRGTVGLIDANPTRPPPPRSGVAARRGAPGAPWGGGNPPPPHHGHAALFRPCPDRDIRGHRRRRCGPAPAHPPARRHHLPSGWHLPHGLCRRP